MDSMKAGAVGVCICTGTFGGHSVGTIDNPRFFKALQEEGINPGHRGNPRRLGITVDTSWGLGNDCVIPDGWGLLGIHPGHWEIEFWALENAVSNPGWLGITVDTSWALGNAVCNPGRLSTAGVAVWEASVHWVATGRQCGVCKRRRRSVSDCGGGGAQKGDSGVSPFLTDKSLC